MKRIAYISLIMAIILGSCDVLDVQPYHSIPAELAITNANRLKVPLLDVMMPCKVVVIMD
jgi:hypothetical protein